MRFKPKPRFERGLLWPDGRGPKATMVGRLLPQPIVEDEKRMRSLLDDRLPDRPVVLVFSEFPDRAIDPRTVESFEQAGATVIGMTPEWMNPEPADFPILRDVSRSFSAPQLASYLESAILLRRDRYVAATRPLERVDELVGPLRNLTGSSHAAVPASGGPVH
jgi:3-(3-hydroxy-phenyl)propionate hydroxylase